MNKKIRIIGAMAVLALWAAATAFAWFSPPKDYSDTERSELAQMPEVKWETLWNGTFMPKFEEFTLDQFPMRDAVRTVKSLFHYYILNMSDNNGFYLAGDTIGKVEYPMNQASVNYAAKRLAALYEMYLKDTDCRTYLTLVPDKGYYMAEENGKPSMDYEAMFAAIRDALPESTYIDITGTLDKEDYYRTDTHWRQEKLPETAAVICAAMGMTAPKAENFTETVIDRPFYGVYYGQAALPVQPETITVLESDVLRGCTVRNPISGKESKVYVKDTQSKDLYDVFLSGPQDILVIENPNARTDRELVVFRDSYGSSMVPLLVQDYKTVTLIDTRYIAPDLIKDYVNFTDQDVLFLYSALILNSSRSLLQETK